MLSTTRLFSLFMLVVCLLSSCAQRECGCEPPPGLAETQLLRTWRLEQIRQGEQQQLQPVDSVNRYTLTFHPQGSYTQTQLVSKQQTQGVWQLTAAGHELHLTDAQGLKHTYTVAGSWPHGGTQPEQLLFYGQTKDRMLQTLVFGLVL